MVIYGRILSASLSALFLAVATSSAVAQPGKEKDPLSWDRNVGALFARHCYACHASDEPSGDVDLASDVDLSRIVAARAKWSRALAMLESKQMPPEDERQPSEQNRQLMLQFLQQTLNNIDCESAKDPGKPILRRLNRTEYDNCVQDLTGLDMHLADSFPPDATGYGFDNIGDALSLTPAQVEMYHAAAKSIVSALFSSPGNALSDRIAQADSRGAAQQLLTRFVSDAFRRPADEYYVNRLLRIREEAIQRGESSAQALGHALTAVLLSPNFLMRIEQDQAAVGDAYPVTDYELAARLSFFLWSRGPDARLLDLAAAGVLSQPDMLRKEVARMLADERSQALVDNFFAQWLGLREVSEHTPDPSLFPEFDDNLRQSMISEVRLLLGEIVRQDRSVLTLIDANFSYLDERLAKHYDLELDMPPGAAGFVRTQLNDRARGGLLTSAAFLMVQSDPGRTNIPRRGNFIAGQLLGDPPPPPPPGVPPLEAVDDGKLRSLRETFELHRTADECKGCHAKIDPLGFSLENYDAIGRYRMQENGLPIDATAEFPGADRFEGGSGLKDLMLHKQDAVLKTMATKLMIYALGRGLQSSDECVLKAMLESAKNSDLRFSSLINELVLSLPFTHRRSFSN